MFLWLQLPWRPLSVVLGSWIPAIATCVLVKWAVEPSGSLLHRLLNWRPVVWMGQLSYSVYLWQQFFTMDNRGAWWQQLPWNVLCLLACALFTHYAVELPFLRLRERLAAG